MAIGLGDIYEKLKELVTITDKVRENTERITKLEDKVDGLKTEMGGLREEFRAFREESRVSNTELKGDIKAVLSQLKTEERIDTLESILREHIAACGKVPEVL